MPLSLIQFKSGASYEGEWKEGMRDGLGKYVWPDKSYYIGNFENDRACGKGRLGFEH